VTGQYFFASFYVSIAFFIYGLPSLITDDLKILPVFAGIALVTNAIGFTYFFLIPLNGWLRPRTYILAKYGLFLFVATLAAVLIIIPPRTSFNAGIIHWRFGPIVGILAAIQMDIAFMLNIILLRTHFYHLKQLSVLNAILLIITFTLAGLGGTYQYVGDSYPLLVLSSISLCVGIGAIFFSVIRGGIARLFNQ
jgi:hypothetical protein